MKSFLRIGILIFFSATLFAGDWPMWRYDAARSAASPDGIATNLTMLWSRKLPTVRPAWPLELEQRLNFDASYEPVVMGKLLFLGSPNDGTVTAYNTDTGEEQWKFYTEGPIRCAPACWKGKIYAGSDDGYLYCFDAVTGKLLWKFRGAPEERPDRRQIGNGHLVSFWPVRGGALVKDGIVYFSAGIWPTFGVFMYALDAETGKVKWSNGDLNYLAKVRVAHDFIRDAGLSPQGYLVAIGDKLVVPNGRGMPAGLELATGRLIYYAQGWRNGNSRVAAHGNYAFVGKYGMVNLYDFRELGSRWGYAGTNQPAGYHNNGGNPGDTWDLHESPTFPYKIAEACDASSAFADGMAYGLVNGTFLACDVAGTVRAECEGKLGTETRKVFKWEPPVIWQLKTACAGQNGTLVIKAGSVLYGCAGKKLLAIENLKGPPRLAWEKEIPGTPSSIVAADSKLFVATTEGGLYCFGEGNPSKTFDGQPKTLEAKTDIWTDKAREILKDTGVKAGYCLVLGLTEGRLIEELLKQSDLLIIAVDADAKKIDALRRRFDALGFLGSRVESFTGNPFDFLFPPYLASLIVSEDSSSAGFPAKADAMKLFNILRPYGGTLCLELPPAGATAFESWAKGAGMNQRIKRDGKWSLLIRDGALPGSASWTHENCDAANTSCSPDELVKAPLGLLWYGDAFGGGTGAYKKAVCGGRVYVLEGHSSRTILFTYDAFTGRPLWKNEINAVPLHVVALAEGVYAAGGGKCLVLDPQTGQTLKTFVYNTNDETHTSDLRIEGDVILIACRKQPISAGPDYLDSTTLVALDRLTGVELWRRIAKNRFNSTALVVGAGKVFCVDSVTTAQTGDKKEIESRLLALDLRTGKEDWSSKRQYTDPPYRYLDNWLAYSQEAGILICGRGGLASALKPENGNVVWDNKKLTPGITLGRNIYCRGGTLYDFATGKYIRNVGVESPAGCNGPVASKYLILMRDSFATYTDIAQGKIYDLRNTRSGCVNSMIPADGLVNVPNFAGCTCNYPIRTSFALVNMPEVAEWSSSTPAVMTPPPALPEMESK